MKISDKTFKILENYSKIDPKGISMYFNKGSTQMICNKGKTIFSEVTLDENFKEEFGIFDLKRFIQTLSLFENPDLEFEGKEIFISEGQAKLTFRTTDKTVIITPKKSMSDVEMDLIEKITLSKEVFQRVLSSASVLGSPDFVIEGDGNNVYITVKNNSDESADKFRLKICQTSKTFSKSLDVGSLKLINHNYDVHVSENLVKFESKEAELSYWLPVS